MGLIPGSRRSPGGGNGNLFQYSWLENPMDRGTWRTTVHGVAKSQPWLKQLITHTHTHTGPYYCPVEPCSCLIYHCWMNFYLFEQQIPLTLWSLWASFQNDIFFTHVHSPLCICWQQCHVSCEHLRFLRWQDLENCLSSCGLLPTVTFTTKVSTMFQLEVNENKDSFPHLIPLYHT